MDSLGYAVAHAENGSQAVSHCMTTTPDVILVDWQLPNDDPIALISSLKQAGDENKRPTVLLLISQRHLGSMTRAKRAGVDGYCMKPFDRSSLSASFRQLGLSKTPTAA